MVTSDEIQTLSRLCPLKDFEDICILLLDNVWTNIGFLGPISVQGHELGHGLDRTLTGTGQTLYVTAIWTDLGQRFDGDLTNFRFFCTISVQPTDGKEYPILCHVMRFERIKQ